MRQTTLACRFLLLTLFTSGGVVSAQSKAPAKPDDSWQNLREVLQLVYRAYVDRVDLAPLLPSAYGGLTDALDPFSTFVPRHEIESFEQGLKIGSSRSGLLVVKDRGIAFVAAVVPGSPGSLAQLRTGDILQSVDGLSTRSMPRWKLQELLAGPLGERRRLEILRGAQERTAVLELADFPWTAIEPSEMEDVAVLVVSRIDSETVAELRERLEDLGSRGVRQLILDLRSCAWGSAEAAYQIASLFSDGPLGSLRKKSEALQTFAGGEPRWTGDLKILTSRSTLGPAEALAGVLQRIGKAELIGERTFGYAGRRKLIRLSTGDALWLTDAFYAGPDGVIFRKSIPPDLEVEERDTSDSSNLEDRVLRRALQRIKGGS